MILGQKKEQNLTRSRSTFYKQIKIEEKGEEKEKNGINESDRNVMINSAYSFKSLQNKKGRSTSVNFKTRKTSAKKVKKDDSKNESRQEKIGEVNESLAVLNTKLREQSIKNIYSNRVKYSQTAAGFKPHQNKSKSIEKDLSLDKKQGKESKVEEMSASRHYTFQDKLKQK